MIFCVFSRLEKQIIMTVTLLLHCPDRPGIIADITNFITENRGNVVYLAQFVEVSDRLALTQPRHLDAVRRAVGHLKDALKTLECFTPDVAATDLQAAQAALSEITGDNADEKLLDSVFSLFCVGK